MEKVISVKIFLILSQFLSAFSTVFLFFFFFQYSVISVSTFKSLFSFTFFGIRHALDHFIVFLSSMSHAKQFPYKLLLPSLALSLSPSLKKYIPPPSLSLFPFSVSAYPPSLSPFLFSLPYTFPSPLSHSSPPLIKYILISGGV